MTYSDLLAKEHKHSSPNIKQIWEILGKNAAQMQSERLVSLFKDPARVEHFSLEMDELYLDYSKNFVSLEIMQNLVEFAKVRDVSSAISRLMKGEIVNPSENRPALHTALRRMNSAPLIVNGKDIMPAIHAEKTKMYRFVDSLQQGKWQGATGKVITDVVNIGIGGSDLGPVMAVEALKAFKQNDLNIHFVSNIDPQVITSLLKILNPHSTLFIISSKSFSTIETLTNADVAKTWLQESLKTDKLAAHFIAVTTQAAKAQAWGVTQENILQFWDWVGGRYSIWSAIGLPLALSIGRENFEAFLRGANAMDTHFEEAPLVQNMPILLALIGIWYINFWQAPTLAVLPYCEGLRKLPDYLQQLDMESNGKSVSVDGETVNYATGPVVWGQAGTNGQHAFYQLLHQGTHLIPVDFIIPVNTHTQLLAQQQQLVANGLAQAQALMQGTDPFDMKFAQEHMPGNKPSNTLLLKEMSPYGLGLLLALYEHKVFVQGHLWQINSFDQPGVELGKKLAAKITRCIEGERDINLDASTQRLIDKIRRF